MISGSIQIQIGIIIYCASLYTCLSLLLVPVLPGETQLSVQLQYSSTRISPSQDLALHCTINCSASLGWTFNGADLPSNTIVSDITSSMTSLTIIDGNKENAGVYACLAHSASERYSNSAAARIEFYGKFSLTAIINYYEVTSVNSQIQLKT